MSSSKYPGTLPPGLEQRIRTIEKRLGITAGATSRVYVTNKSNPTTADGGGSSSGIVTAEFNFPTAQSEWQVNHGLGRKPTVITVNDLNVQIYGHVTYDSPDRVTIRFKPASKGTALII